MNAVNGCLACDLASGRQHLPGGRIHESQFWIVEHCVGPLGVGTLLLKPKRHVTRLAELTDRENVELGPLLAQTARVVDSLTVADQVYACLWSHAGAVPVHIHFVVQPVTRELIAEHGVHGPYLQTMMFDRASPPPLEEVESFASRARAVFNASPAA